MFRSASNKKYFNFSLTHCLPDSVKHSRKLATQRCSIGGNAQSLVVKKPFTILNAYVYSLFTYSFSFNLPIWWPLLTSTALIKGHTQASRIMGRLPHHGQASASCNNVPQQLRMFPNIVMTA